MESQRSRRYGGTSDGAWHSAFRPSEPTSAARTLRRKQQRQHTKRCLQLALQFVKVNRCKYFGESGVALRAVDLELFRHTLSSGKTSGWEPGDNWIHTGRDEQWHSVPCQVPNSESMLIEDNGPQAGWEERWHPVPWQSCKLESFGNMGGGGCAQMLDSGIHGIVVGGSKVVGCAGFG